MCYALIFCRPGYAHCLSRQYPTRQCAGLLCPIATSACTVNAWEEGDLVHVTSLHGNKLILFKLCVFFLCIFVEPR
jgi:hypothetical protein